MEYKTYHGQQFLLINPSEYATAHIDDCLICSKIARVKAVRGKIGQRVKTVLKDNFEETENIVSCDPDTGKPDWIITQESGEKMIVTDKKYKSLYQVKNENENETVNPNGKYRPMIRLRENVAFKTSWGGMQYIKAGGVLVMLSGHDIYGIQKEEFEKSYKIIVNKDKFGL